MIHQQMKKAIIIATCMLSAFSGCAFRKEIVIPRAKIQESVSKKFPYDKDVGIARFTMEAPEVYFKGKNIGLKAVYCTHLLEKETRGSVDVNGKIIYKPETGAFYLHDFVISDITVNEEDLLEKVKVQKIIDKIISNYLDGFRIYRLNPHDHKQNLVRLYVKDIFVRNDDLVVVLGY
jgi:hypothetical protein